MSDNQATPTHHAPGADAQRAGASYWREGALLLLFIVSGFAGLIYQSIWSHYLGLTLGHAAYAQTLVLAIFMGGMALGAFVASRITPRWRNLVLAYAVVEGAIGLIGLVFHPLFVAYLGFSQDTLLPAMDSVVLATAWQWLSGALILLPQSVLLGATFPLLSAGILRMAPAQDGRVLGGLYFSNSIGAALGALVTTFLLLPALGMPGTVFTAGLLNIVVAIAAFVVARAGDAPAFRPSEPVATAEHEAKLTDPALARLFRVLLTATFLSGAFSFVYEIGWVRMLNQALGTTIHSFELMLAAFIAGLAFGGLWIRQRGASIRDVIAYAGYAQVAMGVAALLSVLALANSFTWVGWLLAALARTDNGYTLYSAGSAAIALLVMFPAAFFAGMTLPLFTMALLRAGADERAIGRIYAANTLGAIIGVFAVVHVLIPLISVRLSVTAAALGDALLGFYLLRAISPARATPGYAAAALVTLIAVAVSVIGGRPDPRAQASGVFRHGDATLPDDARVAFLRDGKTATISLTVFPEERTASIATNGKPEAGLSFTLDDAPGEDEATMIELAILPLALHPEPEQVAVIGWGTGLTVNSLMGSPAPRQVDAIEIEPAMIAGARLYGARVQRAYTDPRVTIHMDDARTFFATGARRYDVIISEPSNPWVSGVASLFTREFYAIAARHLNDDGLLVQWLHTYEIDDALLATMVAALNDAFPQVQLYQTNDADLIFVAGKRPIAALDWSRIAATHLDAEMKRLGVGSARDMQLRRIGSQRLLQTYVRLNRAKPHSDFHPLVSLNAPRTRFRRDTALMLQELVVNGMPVLDILEGRSPPGVGSFTPDRINVMARRYRIAAALQTAFRAGELVPELVQDADARVYVPSMETLVNLNRRSLVEGDLPRWSQALAFVADGSLGLLPVQDQHGVWIEPAWISDTEALPAKAREVLAAYAAAAAREPAAMRSAAVQALTDSQGVLDDNCREQLLIIAQLGAIGSGDLAGVAQIKEQFGEQVPVSQYRYAIRGFLLAWADQDAATD
jgi:predicted membrane-bound spermidine synthase